MKTLFAAGFLFCLPLNHVTLQAEVQNPIAAFSTRAPGDSLPAGWRPRLLPNKKGPQFKLVTDHDVTVMRIESHAAAGTIAFDTHINPQATPLLTWRWKVDGVVEKGDLNVKSGDDFAARVYVFFDVPLSSLSFATRTQIQLARLVYGGPVPTAAICYVWDNKHPIGFSARSA